MIYCLRCTYNVFLVHLYERLVDCFDRKLLTQITLSSTKMHLSRRSAPEQFSYGEFILQIEKNDRGLESFNP